MRVVTNEAHLSRYRRLSHILFFVSLAGMAAGFFYTWTADPSTSTQISCFLLPALLFMTLISVRMANTWIREPRPERVLEESLKGIGRRYTLFQHILPAPHVLIGPEGVFTITPQWHERSYRVSGKKWSGDRGLFARLTGYMRQDLLGNPFNEAQLHAQEMQKLVDKIAPDEGIEVQPLIVFTSPKVTLEIDDPIIPVLYADPKKKPSLRGYLRDLKGQERPTLSEEHLDEIDRLYGLVTRKELEAAIGGADLPPDEDDSDDEA